MTATPFLAMPRVPGFPQSPGLIVFPTLFFCVGCLFFEKLTQDHSCNVSFY